MSKNNDKFIALYKELESLVPENVFSFENTLTGPEQKKLQICRLSRNFLQHEDNHSGFIEATQEQIAFLEQLVYQLKTKDGICKDVMTSLAKYGCVCDTDTILKAAETLSKKKKHCIPVVAQDKTLKGFVAAEDIVQAIASGDYTKTAKLSKIKLKKLEDLKSNIVLLEEKAPINMSADTIIVTKNGKITGLIGEL